MGLLDGELQQMFGAAFGVVLLDGRHYRRNETRDAKGNVTGTVISVQTFKGYRETKRTQDRNNEYTDDDGLILMLETYDGRVLDKPARGEVLALDGGRWVIGDIDEDAAHVAWTCQVTRE